MEKEADKGDTKAGKCHIAHYGRKLCLSSGGNGVGSADVKRARACRGGLPVVAWRQQQVVVGHKDRAVGQASEFVLLQKKLCTAMQGRSSI